MNEEIDSFIKFKCYKKLRELQLEHNKVYVDRLDYELSIISKMGFSSYFLVVCDFLSWARKNDIMTGPGRGSCAGSLAAYLLNITAIDPIKYNLLFERFLNPDRISLPDVDLDFAASKRDNVIQYVKDKYGHECVAGIQTFGTLQCRGAIKAVARTLGADYSVGDTLAKMCPPAVNGVQPSLEKCYKEVDKLALYHDKPNTLEGQILNWADKIEDRIDHVGSHASGFVVSNNPLHKDVPLVVDKHGDTITQWDMKEIEKAGLVKFDFLGLTMLDVITQALKLIKKRHQITIDINNIPMDDQKVFGHLQMGDTAGLFQIESSSGIRDLMVRMKPTSINDLAMLVAIFRPGPLSSTYMEKWLRIRAGLEEPEYLIPELEPILKDTQGFLIYQESCMRMAIDLAGYTKAESDQLRKVIGKKLPEEMKKEVTKFKSGMAARGFNKNVIDKLWDDIEAFAGYGFNAAHAVVYAFITYQTAWLKTHYPIEYMCAVLTCNQSDPDQVIKYLFNCREIGIKVLPPDVNKSEVNFSIDESNNIRFGLAAIKNLGVEIVHSIIIAKNDKPFKDIVDFISRIDISKINHRKLDSLVLAGALDSTGSTRASMLDVIAKTIEYKKLNKAYESKMETFHRKTEEYKARLEEIKLNDIAGIKHRLKPFKVPEKPIPPEHPILRVLPELSSMEIQQHEKELIGFYISGHPIDKYKKLIAGSNEYTTLNTIKGDPINGTTVKIIGVIGSIKERTAKASGQKMASSILEDHTGSISMTIFPKAWGEYTGKLEPSKPYIFKCKVNVNENSDGFSVVELVLQSIEHLKYNSINEVTNIKIPLLPKYIGKIQNLINNYKGNEDSLSITLISKEAGELKIPGTFKIQKKDQFIKELNNICEST